jgi:hypothetical protein
VNPEIRQQWVSALRSGDYAQGRNALRSGDDKFCCLGVLCDLAEKAGAIPVGGRFDDLGDWTYGPPGDQNRAWLPMKVMDWAGLDSENPVIDGRGLASYNDGGYTLHTIFKACSFSEIADLIEENL